MTPGQAAYIEWAASVQAVAIGNANDHEIALKVLQVIAPRWDFLSEGVKAIWEGIALAAIKCVATGKATVPGSRPSADEANQVMHSMCTESCSDECTV